MDPLSPQSHDSPRFRIQKNRVQILAGNVIPGFFDGDATLSRFHSPTYVTVDTITANIFVTDNDCVIRQIDPRTGPVSTMWGVAWLDGSTASEARHSSTVSEV
jgi:hypothetical protein